MRGQLVGFPVLLELQSAEEGAEIITANLEISLEIPECPCLSKQNPRPQLSILVVALGHAVNFRAARSAFKNIEVVKQREKQRRRNRKQKLTGRKFKTAEDSGILHLCSELEQNLETSHTVRHLSPELPKGCFSFICWKTLWWHASIPAHLLVSLRSNSSSSAILLVKY